MFLQKLISKNNKHPDINDSRKRIFSKNNQNFNFLLAKRFLLMEPFLKNRKVIIELGSGNGCIKSILKNNKVNQKLSTNSLNKYLFFDYVPNPFTLFENIIAEEDEVLGVSLVSATIPNSFFNLSNNNQNNNEINYDAMVSPSYSIYIDSDSIEITLPNPKAKPKPKLLIFI